MYATTITNEDGSFSPCVKIYGSIYKSALEFVEDIYDPGVNPEVEAMIVSIDDVKELHRFIEDYLMLRGYKLQS